MFVFIYLSYKNLINCQIPKNDNKTIISLISDHNNIRNTIKIINSIIKKNIKRDLYNILLILSINEFNNIIDLPNDIQLLNQQKYIEVTFVKKYLTDINPIFITQKKYRNNPILLINNRRHIKLDGQKYL